MTYAPRTIGKVIFAAVALVQIAIAVAIITFIWWMFAHGFHEIGQFLLQLKSA